MKEIRSSYLLIIAVLTSVGYASTVYLRIFGSLSKDGFHLATSAVFTLALLFIAYFYLR